MNTELLTKPIRGLFFRYFTAAFGSALVVSIYSLVDCAAVGQYEGPEGVAALAVIAPFWTIIISLGLLFGIGGAVLMATARGNGAKARGDEWFTAALIGASTATILLWIVLFLWEIPMLRLFGADEALIPMARRYLVSIKVTAPLFLFSPFLAAFLRNDGVPAKATAAVLCGGAFNIFGDWFFVFFCEMGIFGAGLATAMGQVLTVCILCSHFFSRRCTLRLVRPTRLFSDLKQILITGFPTFFIDISMGVLSMMMNNQVMRYAGASALAVYGVITNIHMLVQSCSYGIGQAAQPLISVNYGAGKQERVREVFLWSMVTVAGMSLVWSTITMGNPILLTRAFMRPTEEVLLIATPIMRTYFLSFLLLPLNVYATYYFQSMLRPIASFAVSVLRGLVVSGLLIYTLPVLLGGEALWWVLPLTELLVAGLVVVLMKTKKKPMIQK